MHHEDEALVAADKAVQQHSPTPHAAMSLCFDGMQVFGSVTCELLPAMNDAVKAAQSAVTTSHFGTGAGFIRSAGEVGYGYEHADTPLIMISKRGFQKGKGAGTSPIFQHITDMIYPVAPGCIAAFDIF